jgi:hypothetical protein
MNVYRAFSIIKFSYYFEYIKTSSKTRILSVSTIFKIVYFFILSISETMDKESIKLYLVASSINPSSDLVSKILNYTRMMTINVPDAFARYIHSTAVLTEICCKEFQIDFDRKCLFRQDQRHQTSKANSANRINYNISDFSRHLAMYRSILKRPLRKEYLQSLLSRSFTQDVVDEALKKLDLLKTSSSLPKKITKEMLDGNDYFAAAILIVLYERGDGKGTELYLAELVEISLDTLKTTKKSLLELLTDLSPTLTIQNENHGKPSISVSSNNVEQLTVDGIGGSYVIDASKKDTITTNRFDKKKRKLQLLYNPQHCQDLNELSTNKRVLQNETDSALLKIDDGLPEPAAKRSIPPHALYLLWKEMVLKASRVITVDTDSPIDLEG